MSLKQLSIRVYGIVIHADRGLLLSKEKIKGNFYTKLPGGGLEFGESTENCLKRELVEELGQGFEIIRLFSVSNLVIESKFMPSTQVVPIYYLAIPKNWAKLLDFTQKHRLHHPEGDFSTVIQYEWRQITDLSADDFSFPAEKALFPEIIKAFK